MPLNPSAAVSGRSAGDDVSPADGCGVRRVVDANLRLNGGAVRTTIGGKVQERYAVVAEVQEGGKPLQMFKFVNKETFDKLNVPEVK